jgi:serine/threonine-protein kinase
LKIGDFGIARDTTATALTAAGSTVGTYAYMAPEQITGTSAITRKTDLYALGCVMYELLTGRTPFQAETMVEMLQKHLKTDPDRITTEAIDCPVWLEALVMKLLEKDPEKRYYDALAVQQALDDVLDKVSKQQSVAKQTLEGGNNATVTAPGAPELKKALGKKKKKKKDNSPFYERVWFLVSVLVFLVAFVAWAVWPLSEEQLYARAKELMATDDIDNWRKAREEYIDTLLEKYPEGKYHVEANEWVDKIEMDIEKRQIENRKERGLDPKSEAEKRYIAAIDFQDFGDLAMAERELELVMESLKSSPEDRPLYLLAEQQHHAVQTARSQSGKSVYSERFILQKLHEAERLYATDKTKADRIWGNISELYKGNAAYSLQVQYALDRLANQPVPPLEPLEGNGHDS